MRLECRYRAWWDGPLGLLPSQRKMVKELAVWLGMDPDDWEEMVRRATVIGGHPARWRS